MKAVKLSFILMAIFSVATFAQDKKPIEFEHIFDGTFSPNGVQNVRWMNDGEFYTALTGMTLRMPKAM